MSRVVVCGSLNMDIVVQSARRPVAGETQLGGKVSFLPGGKGLNQAASNPRTAAATDHGNGVCRRRPEQREDQGEETDHDLSIPNTPSTGVRSGIE